MASLAPGLFAKYGNGIAKSGAEVSDFQLAMQSAKLSEAQACVLGAWLGGAPESAWKMPDTAWGALVGEWHTFRDTVEDVCKSTISVDSALQALKERDFELAKLVEAKAKGKAYKEQTNENENVVQDVKKIAENAKEALSFDVFGLKVTPKHLVVGGLVIAGLVVIVKVRSAMRKVVG